MEGRFAESRRKVYYLMSVRELLPPQARRELKKWAGLKGLGLGLLARRDGQHLGGSPAAGVTVFQVPPRSREADVSATGD